MSRGESAGEPDASVLAQLSALADGRLEPAHADSLRTLIATSPDLQQRYDRERRAVRALRALRGDQAPLSLRLAIDSHRHRVVGRGRRVGGGALAAGLAAAVALLVLLLPGGSPGAPSVGQAAALALHGATLPAPRAATRTRLNEDVQEVYFPNWAPSYRYRAVGRRVDDLDGRRAVTVYYRHGGSEIAYTILAAPALRWPRGDRQLVQGVELQSFVLGGRLVVTWRRAGHTCVLSGSGVTVSRLATLAAWKAPDLEA